MSTTEPQPAVPACKLRWYRLTPERLVVGVLLLEGLLFLSEWFQWFAFNKYKGWSVLIAVSIVAVATFFMLLWFADSLLYRRRFQFSIRSLLLLTVVIAIPCSWLANEIRWAKRQREALAEIDKTTYGKYSFPVGTYSYPVDELGWPTYWPRRVLGDDFFVSVHYVFLGGPGVTDAVLENLKGLPQLQRLSLDGTKITDAGLENLEGLHLLQQLSILHSPITDAGLDHLKRLTRLQKLALEYTQITDAGLEHLEGLRELQRLSLLHSPITDAGLEHLKGLTRLRRLCLYDTKCTDEGVAKLQQALPNCKIER
jgi:Leucine-rich repeat (LRR) protein